MGRYISQSDLVAQFGTDAIAQWSNRSNADGSIDTAVVATAIAHAEDVIDDRFRGRQYTLPLTASSGSLPRAVVKWCCVMAAQFMYEQRGRRDGGGDEAVNRLDALVNEANGEIDSVLSGQRKLALQTIAKPYTAPKVVT